MMVLQSSKTAPPSWGQGFAYEPFGDTETLTALVGTHPTGRETKAHRIELLEDTAWLALRSSQLPLWVAPSTHPWTQSLIH